MKKIALFISLILFVLLAACSQNPEPSPDLSPQDVTDSLSVSPSVLNPRCGSSYGQVTVNAFSKSILPFDFAFSVARSSLPAGMTANFSRTQINTNDATSRLNLSINGVAGGSYPIIIEDSRGETTTLTVNIDNPVNIPDALLASQIKQTLNIPAANVVCKEDMLLLTSFSTSGILDISYLEGLQYAKNLESLAVVYQSIQDFTPHSGLTQLKSLNLHRTWIGGGNPTFLSKLTNLTHLNLSRNSISNLTPLSNLTKLTYLNLGENQISDLTPLSNLSNLTTLHLSYNQISDIAPLSNLTNLIHLSLWQNNISDLTPLVYNPALGSSKGASIWVSYNPLGLSDPNDRDHDNIQILQSRGATVWY